MQAPVLGICCPRVLTDPQALQLIPSPGLIPRGSISSSPSQSWKGQGMVFKEALPFCRFAWCEQCPTPSLQAGLPALCSCSAWRGAPDSFGGKIWRLWMDHCHGPLEDGGSLQAGRALAQGKAAQPPASLLEKVCSPHPAGHCVAPTGL